MSKSQQLSLDLLTQGNLDPFAAEDFLRLDENELAFTFLEKFFRQGNFTQSQFPSVILKGSSGAGKTHLLHIFAKQYDIEFVRAHDHCTHSLSDFFEANKFYVLENIHDIKDEEFLFHFINAAVAAKSFLVLTTHNKTHFKINDLNSRVRNIVSIEIQDPGPDAIKMLLINFFARKQLVIPGKIITVIADHIDRTYQSVRDAVKLVEFYRDEEGKKMTAKEAKRIFSKS